MSITKLYMLSMTNVLCAYLRGELTIEQLSDPRIHFVWNCAKSHVLGPVFIDGKPQGDPMDWAPYEILWDMRDRDLANKLDKEYGVNAEGNLGNATHHRVPVAQLPRELQEKWRALATVWETAYSECRVSVEMGGHLMAASLATPETPLWRNGHLVIRRSTSGREDYLDGMTLGDLLNA